jgi:ankyrin repeat protein
MKKWIALALTLIASIVFEPSAFAAPDKEDLLYLRNLYRATEKSDNQSLRKLMSSARKKKVSLDDQALLLGVLIERGNLEGLTIASRAGTDMNQILLGEREGERLGLTPLNFAISLPKPEAVVNHLIRLGADVNRTSNDDMPPILSAVSVREYGVLDILLSNKANPNATDKVFGFTALMIVVAREKDHTKSALITRKLIDYGANVNGQVFTGHTPLMLAAQAGNADAALLLLQAGADITYINDHGETALSLAKKFNFTEISDMLEKAGNKAVTK